MTSRPSGNLTALFPVIYGQDQDSASPEAQQDDLVGLFLRHGPEDISWEPAPRSYRGWGLAAADEHLTTLGYQRVGPWEFNGDDNIARDDDDYGWECDIVALTHEAV